MRRVSPERTMSPGLAMKFRRRRVSAAGNPERFEHPSHRTAMRLVALSKRRILPAVAHGHAKTSGGLISPVL